MIMAEGDYIVTSIPILTILIGVGTLAGFIYKIGSWINKKAAEKATALKAVTEAKADELKKYAEEMAKDVRELNEKQIQDLKDRLGHIDEKVEKMLSRADLVNGNVSNIRTDIADLQEDLLELYDVKSGKAEEEEEEEEGMDKKRAGLKRRVRRREIERDRVNQDEARRR